MNGCDKIGQESKKLVSNKFVIAYQYASIEVATVLLNNHLQNPESEPYRLA